MKPEAQRIAIAEACGWKKVSIWLFEKDGKYRGQTDDKCLIFIPVPDYLNDLNAMHEAEKALSEGQRFEYHNQIFDIVVPDENHGCSGVEGDTEDIMVPSGFTMLHATAPQRAEAFLRTIGKWEDS